MIESLRSKISQKETESMCVISAADLVSWLY